VRSELLEPLGLQDTTYLPIDGAAVGTSRDPRTGALVGERVQETGAMAPAGQLWSTPRDLLRWSTVLARGSGDLLSANSAAEMRVVQSGDPDEQHRGGYGLGLRLRWTGAGTLVGHTGSMPGFLAGMFADPATGVGAVVMTNATTGLDPERLAADMVATLQPMSPPRSEREEEPDEADRLPDLVGEWFWGNTPYLLAATSDGLKLTVAGEVRRFIRHAPDRYLGLNGYYAGEELCVVRRPDGAVSHLEVSTFVLTREPYDPAAPIPGGPPLPLE
jgi:D-alanyl-D-alanine carboxypeptidase